jgi:hypothetical protein
MTQADLDMCSEKEQPSLWIESGEELIVGGPVPLPSKFGD